MEIPGLQRGQVAGGPGQNRAVGRPVGERGGGRELPGLCVRVTAQVVDGDVVVLHQIAIARAQIARQFPYRRRGVGPATEDLAGLHQPQYQRGGEDQHADLHLPVMLPHQAAQADTSHGRGEQQGERHVGVQRRASVQVELVAEHQHGRAGQHDPESDPASAGRRPCHPRACPGPGLDRVADASEHRQRGDEPGPGPAVSQNPQLLTAARRPRHGRGDSGREVLAARAEDAGGEHPGDHHGGHQQPRQGPASRLR
jgi:hypothetical protein